jgi:predicted lipoprotein
MRLSFLNFIILKKKIFSLFILLFYLSCSTDDVEEQVPNINITTEPSNNFDREGMLLFWADSIIIPAHQKFQNDLINLSNSINDFSSDTSASSLNNVRENWTTAYKSWQHIEMFNIGKAEEINFPV